MASPEFKPSKKLSKAEKDLKRIYDRMNRDPKYKEKALSELKKDLEDMEKTAVNLPPFIYEGEPLSPLLKSVADTLAKRVIAENLTPKDVKGILSNPDQFSSLIKEGADKLIDKQKDKPTEILISPN